MTTVVDRILIDTNVLVYASLRHSAFHAEAVQAIHSQILAGTELWVSRQILREYIAVLTRPGTTTLSSPAMSAASDVAAFQQMLHVADETSAVTANLLALVKLVPAGGKQIHDANLVAAMQTYKIPRLLTHNVSDFARFRSLITIVPLISRPSIA